TPPPCLCAATRLETDVVRFAIKDSAFWRFRNTDDLSKFWIGSACPACPVRPSGLGLSMSVQEINEAVMQLPEKERLELARRIVASIVAEQENSAQVIEAVQGIEDVVTGKVRGLSEAEFR